MFIVVGLKNVVAKKDGRRFVELHLLSDDRFVSGKRCDVVFVSEEQISNLEALALDCEVSVFYNRFGRVESVQVIL